jgi:protein-L-isoaspartate O-methyltransferase
MQQLRPGGIIIIPTGDNKQQQLHKVIEKDGDYIHTMHDLCTFVPLMGKLGWK